jgi:hypothetical protein
MMLHGDGTTLPTGIAIGCVLVLLVAALVAYIQTL